MGKPDWEITATTVYCEAIDDEVTLMVYADGTSRCTGRDKYSEKKVKRPAKTKNRECTGVDCTRLSQYHDSLLKN